MSVLSVVIPSFDEEGNISNTVSTVSGILENAGIDYELIFVDDGSSDKTYELILKEAATNDKVKGISFSRNFGKEASIFAGLSVATGDCVAVMDCDLQHPPALLPQMFKCWQDGFEVVEGIKSSRGKEGFFHKICAGFFYSIMSKLIRMDMKATSDYKLLDRKVVNALLSLPEKNTFFRALSFWVGFKTTKLEYDVEARKYGKTKWSFTSLMKYAINNATSFSTFPLQIVTFMGVVSVLFSIALGIQTLVKYFMGTAEAGFPTVILLILLVGGFIMISLGIIGHYLARIYEEVKGRPRFIIRAHTDNIKGNI